MINKIKNLGQIYTPINIVNDMLNLIGYSGENILKKHIIDNSCGNGAFLTQITERYITAYKNKYNSLENINKDLESFIHGIEIDNAEYNECVNNLNKTLFLNGIGSVDWDVICADTLQIDKYDGKMDFVVANPPYVRIHNLQDNFKKVRDYNFSKNGMTDLFIVFYEIGFKMLNNNGKLVYITPNSFYSSVAGQEFRNFIINNKQLTRLIDLGHYQPFKATAYTVICVFDASQNSDCFDYSVYNKGLIEFKETLLIKDAFNNGKMILAKKREQEILKEIQNYIPHNKNVVQVKNAFATLADPIFIKNNFEFDSKNIISILKASTGEWKKCIFPYDDTGKIVKFNNFEKELQNYLLMHKQNLLKRSLDKKTEWYAFGRSQAINDVTLNKIAINTTIKDIKTIKLNEVGQGQGVYSGLYILTGIPFQKISNIIKHQDFIDYIATIGKCKSGGYYTFSSSDLKQYLYYELETKNER